MAFIEFVNLTVKKRERRSMWTGICW